MARNISILGSGIVGRTLAQGFLKLGDKVMIGSRSPEKLSGFISQNTKIKSGTFGETAKFGDLIVLCCKGDAVEEVINYSGKENLEGKIIIDTTNPLAHSDRGTTMFIGYPNSLSKKIQAILPESMVVKAFNIIPSSNMVNPKLKEGNPTLFIAGNDKTAKLEVTKIANSFGWLDVIDLGDLEKATLIEALGMLYIDYAMSTNKWSSAFRLLRE